MTTKKSIVKVATLDKPITVNTEGLSMLRLAELQDGMSELKNETSYVRKLKGQAELIAAFTSNWSADEIVNLSPDKFGSFIKEVMAELQGNVPFGSATNS